MTKLNQLVNKRTKTALLIDVHNLTYRCVFVANKQDPLDENFTYWKFLVLNNILNNIKLYDADLCVLAFDGREYWRKDIYPDYKGQRKSGRDESPVNFDKFFPVMHEFFEDFREVFKNIMFLQIHKCEADDIIATLVKDELKHYDEVINISNDRDMYQLMKYNNYKQYDPIKKKFIEHINVQQELLIKILTGDRSDNIPGVKDKCGPKTAKKMIELGLDNSLLNESVKEKFELNKQLIDFECIPIHITSIIKQAYKNFKLAPYDGGKSFNFFVKHRLNVFIDKIQEFSPSLKQLV